VGARSRARDRREQAPKALPSTGGMEVSLKGRKGTDKRRHAACQNAFAHAALKEPRQSEQRDRGKLK